MRTIIVGTPQASALTSITMATVIQMSWIARTSLSHWLDDRRWCIIDGMLTELPCWSSGAELLTAAGQGMGVCNFFVWCVPPSSVSQLNLGNGASEMHVYGRTVVGAEGYSWYLSLQCTSFRAL